MGSSTANLEFLAEVGAIVLGRAGHDQMAPAWSGSDSPMARLMNSLPKVVFTSTPLEFEWSNARRASRPLVAAGLVDEFRITVHPVALGDGLPLWHGLPEPRRFGFVGATSWADGAVTFRLSG